MSAAFERHGSVAVIRLNNPPVNGLSHALRSMVVRAVVAAGEDPLVAAIVLIGSTKGFSGGADIKEFNKPEATAEPTLGSLIATLENCSKPVVAAIGGVCMGGGLELALSCHFRVALATAQLALPEVKLGLLPGAGGTQRLPRLVGVERALQMIVSGEAVSATRLASTRLLDWVVDGELLDQAITFAKGVVAEDRPLVRARDIAIEFPNASAFFEAKRSEIRAATGTLAAPLRCLDAVAASVALPFEEGLRVERELFAALVASPESKALRHAFFSERAAAKVSDLAADVVARPVTKVGVVGAGTMGGGISMAFLNAGIPVVLLESQADNLERGVATIRRNYEGTVKKGKLTQQQLEQRMDLLRPTLSYADLREVDLAIEAVFEEMRIKEEVFTRLDAVVKEGAILATNTSTLDVNRIAAITKRPESVLGLHFFSPAHVMKLLEVVRGAKTAPDVLATAMQLAGRIGKVAVVAGVCDGFIGNRMLAFYLDEAHALLEAGAVPSQVDRALEAFGLAMGPFRMCDLAGNDIGWALRKQKYALDPSQKKPHINDELCELGRFGQKTGAGFYRYEKGSREAVPDPKVDEMIAAFRKTHGLGARVISDQEIVERCVLSLINEAARILEEGIAQRASDIDVVYMSGYGFPRWRGGPMMYADSLGLDEVVRMIQQIHQQTGNPRWQPADLLAKLAAEGKTFTSS